MHVETHTLNSEFSGGMKKMIMEKLKMKFTCEFSFYKLD